MPRWKSRAICAMKWYKTHPPTHTYTHTQHTHTHTHKITTTCEDPIEHNFSDISTYIFIVEPIPANYIRQPYLETIDDGPTVALHCLHLRVDALEQRVEGHVPVVSKMTSICNGFRNRHCSRSEKITTREEVVVLQEYLLLRSFESDSAAIAFFWNFHLFFY